MLTAKELFETLQRVRFVRYTSEGNTPGWDGSGAGSVVVESPSDNMLTFTESGKWQPRNGRESRFTNVFRWTVAGVKLIKLEHLRFGPDNPVFLFEVAPSDKGEWSSVHPHLCDRDCYSAQLQVRESEIWVCWVINGPQKNERIEYFYSW